MRKEAQKFSFASDTFIAAAFEYRPDIAEHIVRKLTGRPDLCIVSSHGQYDIHSVRNRSIRCDAVATDASGKLYNIEIQRRSKGAEPERARYHSALLDSSTLGKSADFTDLPETYVIFITEGDVLGGGRPLYHIDRTVREMEHAPFGDRAHIIYAVMKNSDDSELGSFLRAFLATEAAQIPDPKLAECMDYFKKSEKGDKQMCEIMERIVREENEKTEKKARWETQRDNVLRMLNKGLAKQEIMIFLNLTDKEFAELLVPKAG